MKKIVILGILVALVLFIVPVSACECCCDPKTPGYWKNHPDEWPADVVKITHNGCILTYDKMTAIDWMNTPVKGDKSINMFSAVVSAKLNWMSGCHQPPDRICDFSDEWLIEHPVGSGVKASSEAWKECEPVFTWLDNWNNS